MLPGYVNAGHMQSSGSSPQPDRQAIEDRLCEEVQTARAVLQQTPPIQKGEALKDLQDAVHKLNDLVMNGKLPKE
jgi:hypothetical protein